MCDILKFKFRKESREAYAIMYATLVLTRFQHVMKNKKENYGLPKIADEKEFQTLLGLDKKDAKKDWIALRCCDQLINDEKVGFLSFLERVSKTHGLASVSAVTFEGNEANQIIYKVKKEILEAENKISTPLLESLKFAVNTIDNVEIELAMALTNLFYYSKNENIKYKKNIQTLTENLPHVAWLKMGYLLNIVLTLLVKQNICPHFALFMAYFACLENCIGTPTSSSAKIVMLTEWTNLSLVEWIEEPPKDQVELMQLWNLNRPLLEEMKNVVFQIMFTIYISILFDLNVDMPGDLSSWRINKCRRVNGYDIYHTYKNKTQFSVPNLGNMALFIVAVEEKTNPTIDVIGILQTFEDYITKWNKPKSKKRSYEFQSVYLFEDEKSKLNLPTTPLIVNEKEKIQKWLKKVREKWENIVTDLPFDKDQIEEFLVQVFPNYIKSLAGDTVSDGLISNHYGFPYEEKKIKIPQFVLEGFFETSNFIYPLLERSEEDLIVDPEIESLAITLRSFSFHGTYKSLHMLMVKNFGKFLGEVSDHYTIEAKFLPARKKMREHGVSFLTLLQDNPHGISEKLVLLHKLKENLTGTLGMSFENDKQLRKLLLENLKVSDPSDFQHYLTALMFLSFLKPEKKRQRARQKNQKKKVHLIYFQKCLDGKKKIKRIL